MGSEVLTCPFCGYQNEDAYFISLHVEQLHTDDSPFQVRSTSPPLPLPKQQHAASSTHNVPVQESQGGWVQCPHEDCGEELLLEELNEHLDLHVAEKLSSEDDSSITRSSMASSTSSHYSFARNHHSSESFQKPQRHPFSQGSETPKTRPEKVHLRRSVRGIGFDVDKQRVTKDLPLCTKDIRLGKNELGPYANENTMPAWLHAKLENGGKAVTVNRIGLDGRLVKDRSVENEVSGLLPVLVNLINQDQSVQKAYFCHPGVQHVSKLPREGGFCGYRNTQMLISYMQGAKASGHEVFAGEMPGVLELQDLIEAAWDMGIGELGRVQTGGIKNTRKYIGTPEVAALFGSLGIDIWVRAFHDKPKDGPAAQQLFDFVEHYFERAATQPKDKIQKTLHPPIYLQRPGHSLTIVGLEIHKDGSRNLLVFDPMYVVSKEMRRFRDGATRHPKSVGMLLKMYRRSEKTLDHYCEFETIELTGIPPASAAWDNV